MTKQDTTSIDEPDELLANTKNPDPRATRALQDHFWDMEDEPNLEQEITNIFITIDNYGTAEEARVDIRKLIATQIQEAYKKGFLDGGMEVINGRSTPNEPAE